MTEPLFSMYSQGENRVTSTIIAVFSRINSSLLQQILQGLMGDYALTLVRFQNQPREEAGIPDALLRASFSYWIETKRSVGALRKDPLERYLETVEGYRRADDSRLLVLTPDPDNPPVINELQKSHPWLYWSSFANLVTTISDVLADPAPLPTDREVFLLKELVTFLEREGLTGANEDDVLLVAANRFALDDYHKYSAYICPSERTFRQVKRMAFYSEGVIDVHVPHVVARIESISLSESGLSAEKANLHDRDIKLVADLISVLRKENSDRVDFRAKVLFLSGANDPQTHQLSHAIKNDARGPGGQVVAFTRKHRYLSFDALKKEPRTTSELEQLSSSSSKVQELSHEG